MVTATCPDCAWSMPCEDAEDAALMLELHRVVKWNRMTGMESPNV
jgi:hypothetical protein